MYKPILIRTLKHFRNYNLPLTKKELFELSIFENDENPPHKDWFEKSLKELMEKGVLYIKDGFLSLDKNDLPIDIRQRKISQERYKEIERRCLKHADKIKKDYIKCVLLIKNEFLNGNKHKPQESADVLLIAEEGKEQLARLNLKRFLKAKKIRYRNLHILNTKNLNVPRDIEWAHALSTAKIINNKGGFDDLLSQNNWFFERLKNYPLSNLSNKYKIEKRSKKEPHNIKLSTKIVNKIAGFICDKLYT